MKNLIHSFDPKTVSEKLTLPVIAGIVIGSLLLGVITGFGGSKIMSATTSSSDRKETDKNSETSSTSAGIKDEETFPDTAEGVLREGGFEGEGSFHLERPGGESQTVYLTSSAVDLSEFTGKKVKVWGKTFDAEKVAWLMDVGYVEVVK